MRKFYGIQYLRAAAALGVVCFHAAERTGGHFAIGAAGVDVFFVVSGFLMWVISENKPASPGRFFRDRLERVAPVYWIATCVTVLAAALLVGVLALEKGGVVGRIGPAAYIGDSSDSIYLWHTMAISVVAKFAMLLSIPAPIAFLVAVVGGVVVGAAFYEILERPIAASLKGLRAWPDRTNLQSERASC